MKMLASGVAATSVVLAVLASCPALAQQPPSKESGIPGGQMQQIMQPHNRQMMQGQTDQKIVRILEADPNTDWSKVNLEALRQHLIDMNEVTLKADVVTKPLDGGIEATVTGSGRTVEAIQRMVPAHAHQIDQTHLDGWSAKTKPLPNGIVLTVTSDARNRYSIFAAWASSA
jgi:hypothetical protein